jgi:ribosomal-protein-serine acetyltransferase
MNFDNFSIEPLEKEDAQNYFLLIENNRGRIVKYFPNVTMANRDIDSTVLFIAERIRLAEKKELFSYIVRDIDTEGIVGGVFLKNLDWHVQKCEFSFFIDGKYEGKGIMTKAVSLLADHCFRELRLNKVTMRIAEDNISSRRVAEKNGFVAEGILRQDFKTSEGEFIDVVYYGLLNTTAGKAGGSEARG